MMNRYVDALFLIMLCGGLLQVIEASLFSRALGQRHILASQKLPLQSVEEEVSGCFAVTGMHHEQVLQSLRLRGGATVDEGNKVKGTCIGIDLGTTYR